VAPSLGQHDKRQSLQHSAPPCELERWRLKRTGEGWKVRELADTQGVARAQREDGNCRSRGAPLRRARVLHIEWSDAARTAMRHPVVQVGVNWQVDSASRLSYPSLPSRARC